MIIRARVQLIRPSTAASVAVLEAIPDVSRTAEVEVSTSRLDVLGALSHQPFAKGGPHDKPKSPVIRSDDPAAKVLSVLGGQAVVKKKK